MGNLPAKSAVALVSARPRWALILAAVAIIFGLASIVSGGLVLFGSPANRVSAGAVVPYVLWFNFLTGFVYIIAGIGLIRWRRWSGRLSLLLAIAILITSAVFAARVAIGGPYEIRTAGALLLRASLWASIAFLACRQFGCLRHSSTNSTHL